MARGRGCGHWRRKAVGKDHAGQVQRRDMAARHAALAAGDARAKKHHAAQRIDAAVSSSLVRVSAQTSNGQIDQAQIDRAFPGIAGEGGIKAAAPSRQRCVGGKANEGRRSATNMLLPT